MLLEQAVLQAFRQIHADESACKYYLEKSFPAFEGHFENHPLLPAVVQIGFCADTIGRLRGKKQQVVSISRAKFVRPILPETEFTVTATPRPDGQFTCTITAPNGEVCSRLTLRTEEFL